MYNESQDMFLTSDGQIIESYSGTLRLYLHTDEHNSENLFKLIVNDLLTIPSEGITFGNGSLQIVDNELLIHANHSPEEMKVINDKEIEDILNGSNCYIT